MTLMMDIAIIKANTLHPQLLEKILLQMNFLLETWQGTTTKSNLIYVRDMCHLFPSNLYVCADLIQPYHWVMFLCSNPVRTQYNLDDRLKR